MAAQRASQRWLAKRRMDQMIIRFWFLVSGFWLGTIERLRGARYRYYMLAAGEQDYPVGAGFQDRLLGCGAIHF